VLVEVPVMLSVCKVCNTSRGWYGRGAAAGVAELKVES
jgi:ACR3 family arsenite efflux pump ArsB